MVPKSAKRQRPGPKGRTNRHSFRGLKPPAPPESMIYNCGTKVSCSGYSVLWRLCMQRFLLGFGVALWLGGTALAQSIQGRDGIKLPPPPAVDAIEVTDNYFGTKINDKYRWLEDSKSPETRAYIDAQNTYTARYMKQARIRPQVEDDLDELERVSRWTMPMERNGVYFFQERLAGEEQASIYVRRGWAGKDERLIDPAKLSKDPNTSVALEDVSRDGALLAYELRQGGVDEASVHIADTKTGKVLEDELPTGRYFSVNFTPDGKALYYCRSNKQGTLLYEHVLGTRNAQDKLIFGHEFHGEALGPIDLINAWVTDDGRYLGVEIGRGVPAKR